MEDYFDILGINGIEDSYTNLLVAAFNDSEIFKILYSKPEWVRLRMPDNINEVSDDEQQSYSGTRNVHIEINWTPNRKKMSIFVHYETNPYLPEKELRKLSKNIYENFEKSKNEFKEVLHRNKPINWKKGVKYLTLIKTSLSINESVSRDRLYNWLLSNIELASIAIEKTFEEIEINN